ncbi:hypothetical protein C8A01DRAFT_18650 [Parachaetomium inaequale]|uniref:Uncharacterized protein n=1 Tax=Parachaetomium inaequale TaxID=2588326 RepID=A0AAN6PEM9_9PEZI|nr:hypothetical protein C8A01DRAFT_18650 [Parachaetomium inaequale]
MSRLGQNLIKVPDLSGSAKNGCKNAGDAVDNTIHQVTDTAQDVGNTVTDTAQDIGNTVTSIFGRDPSAGDMLEGACNKGAEIVDDAAQIAADAVDDFLGSVAKAIGIKEYYSVHIGVLCEGEYDKTFNKEGAKPIVQECSKKFYTGQTDLSKKLDQELGIGPVKLSDIKLVQEIQDAFDKIPKYIAAMAYFFLIGVLALFAGFLCAAAVLAFEFKERLDGKEKIALFAAMGCLGFGWFITVIGAAVTTGVAETIKNVVNEHGGKYGVSANTSPALWFLLWGSVVFTTAALGLLVCLWLRTRNGKGMEEQYAKNNQSTASSVPQSNGYFQQEPLN